MLIRDHGGGPAEKRGNTVWVDCPACRGWLPVAPRMLEPSAPECVCPACHAGFRPDPEVARAGPS